MTAELDPERLKEVVNRAKTHDADAWELLYRHSYQRLLSYARRRLPSVEAAEEAVSETMLRAVRGLESFTWRGVGFDGWMYGILRNVVLEKQRGPQRSAQLTERYGSDPTRRRDDSAGYPEYHLDRMLDNAGLRAAFAALDPGDQEVLELRIVGELSAADAGAVIGKSAGAVRMAQSRALERLRTAMKEVEGQ